MMVHRFGILVVILFGLAGCSPEGEPPAESTGELLPPAEPIVDSQGLQPAQTIYTNARIYTLDAGSPWAEAVAIRDGLIAGVGTADSVMALAGAETEIIDLEGRMVMPGIHDLHNHPSDAGMRELFECNFGITTLEDVTNRIAECAANTEPGEWIRGGQWSPALFTTDESPRDILDAITTDHPVFLMDWSVHNAWVNSAALGLFGIGPDTPDPDGGIIERDPETGEPTGILYDNAAYGYRRQLPEYTLDQRVRALSWAIGELIGFGVTSFKEAIVTQPVLEAYHAIDQARGLPARVQTSLTWKSEWADSNAAEQDLLDRRNDYRSEMLDPDFAKIMLDGIPPSYTAALLEPYLPSEEYGDDFLGIMMLEYDELIEDVVELDRQGVTVKIHATGDRSLRSALDAFEAARERNGDSGLVHEVSHAQMIHADDLGRFSELNVAAEMCPILWYPLPGGGAASVLGEERSKVWPIRNLVESGALTIYGSDWPAIVPDANPWPGIEAMVTRSDPHGRFPGSAWPEQAVDLATAVRIFTLNGAVAAKTGDKTGSIEVGKAADFIVLDRNIFDVPIEEVGDTEVLITVVDGRHVFER